LSSRDLSRIATTLKKGAKKVEELRAVPGVFFMSEIMTIGHLGMKND
tara:strand:- start:416 stop:556 length:141 start_codon:yes stop_codon:yes gene_type:complete